MCKKGVFVINTETTVSNKLKKIPKTAPLVYINRLKMTELNEKNKYNFIPVIKDEQGEKIYRCKLDQEKKILYDNSVKRKVERDNRNHMILTAESELIRIIKHLSENNKIIKGTDYVHDILSLKIGNSYSSYKTKMNDNECNITYNGKKYKRIIVSSSHSRTQKAMFVSAELWDKAIDILQCGISRDTKYKYMSKWNSYIGLAATDSIPVSMPNIVIVDDLEMWQKAKVDVVQEIAIKDEDGYTKRKFNVLHDKIKRIKTNLFDGAGIVCVRKAQEWSEELNLDYIPASFQFRCIPGLKGKLYTMPVEEFAQTFNSRIIKDIYGKDWDLFEDKIDCILTKSQFKFYELFNSYEHWYNEFKKETHGYKRTFNISEYDIDYSKLNSKTVMAYQPLQTLDFTDEEISKLCEPTVRSYKKACSSVEEFLKYRGIINDSNSSEDVDWNKYPPYYQAIYYNHSLFNDKYIQKKIKQDLKSGRERAYVGKIQVNGNYQTLTPDLFALMQHTFGLKVTGLLKGNDVYSNYWNFNLIGSPWIDIIRSPHIAREHCPVQVVTSEAMEKWFAYQKTGIIISVFGNTIALKLNSADFDGDHVLTTDNKIICDAARKQYSNTIYHEKIVYPYTNNKNAEKIDISDMSTIIDCDYKGYKNNIGNVINPISVLWSLDKSEKIADYIKIMSIVGSITIDYAKHGEEAETPKKIKNLLKEHKKPYFMQYLKPNRKKRSMEKELKAVAKVISDEYESIFEDSDCTMNRICHYMENEISDIKVTTKVKKEFKLEEFLIKLPDITTHKYKKIKDTLIYLQEEFYDITNQNYVEYLDDNKDNLYTALYYYAKSELLEIESNISELLDILLVIYYSDRKFMKNYQDKTILWACFGEELIERAKGNFEKSLSEDELAKIKARKAKAEKCICDIKDFKEKNFIIREFESEENRDNIVSIYKEDIKWIKRNISPKIKRSTECRKLMLALIYICRKCDTREITLYQNQNNMLNRTTISKLVKIDRKYLLDLFTILQELKIIKMDIDKRKHLTVQILKMVETGKEELQYNVDYKKLYSIANDKFREKYVKIVKNECA